MCLLCLIVVCLKPTMSLCDVLSSVPTSLANSGHGIENEFSLFLVAGLMATRCSFVILPSSTRFTTPIIPTTMNPDYVSDDSMSNSFELDGSDLSDAPSDETVILLTPPSSPEPRESDGHQVEVPTLPRSTHSVVRPTPVLGTTSVYFGGYS
ncbi:hypothetical protein PR003_g1793 [Phytophthora rubi]|uniref:Secreted protein n=1 Tax=Phytophthora rubi TaxID=129364 RepID=A0A6A4FUF1_9STRA|nr:hypothetical protein PR002_g1852 [Phytophthora rubi]KAE9051122.1 hypothetical protein PR001_g1741 [Phytophthora rubi]KAE9357432.1 hypothetical protein PR003_g1793 [Phytophthora rubi]